MKNYVDRKELMLMEDIIKFRALITNGYWIESIKEDAEGTCVIGMTFSGSGVPIEGQIYYFITKDEAIIRKAHEIRNI